MDLYKTGGGTAKPHLDDLEAKIVEVCSNQFIPPNNPMDSDFGHHSITQLELAVCMIFGL